LKLERVALPDVRKVRLNGVGEASHEALVLKVVKELDEGHLI
jgi:hypothetical protein